MYHLSVRYFVYFGTRTDCSTCFDIIKIENMDKQTNDIRKFEATTRMNLRCEIFSKNPEVIP